MWPFTKKIVGPQTEEDWWRDVMKCEPWYFVPQPDITAFELAQIIQNTRNITGLVPCQISIDKNSEWELIKRHFVKVEA